MAFLGGIPNIAEEICKPELTIAEPRISGVTDLQRTWSAIMAADASRCSTPSGLFQIEFTRLKENAPDMQFVEQFRWRRGQSQISLDIWWDEWLQSYRIAHIAPCPSRNE
jgi:hypothetical protein